MNFASIGNVLVLLFLVCHVLKYTMLCTIATANIFTPKEKFHQFRETYAYFYGLSVNPLLCFDIADKCNSLNFKLLSHPTTLFDFNFKCSTEVDKTYIRTHTTNSDDDFEILCIRFFIHSHVEYIPSI